MVGTMICAVHAERFLARKLAKARRSKAWRFTASRRAACTVRTPLMFSASAALHTEEASRAARKVSLARGSHSARTTITTGSEVRVSSPSRQSITTSSTISPTSRNISPIACTEVSRNSCSEFTSP